MICKDCKYKKDIGNTDDTGAALCSYPESFFLVNIEDDCYYIPKNTPLTCGDCAALDYDYGCLTCTEDTSAIINGSLCIGYKDKREAEFRKFLMFWKIHGLYDREKIIKIIDEFDDSYKELTEQEMKNNGKSNNKG